MKPVKPYDVVKRHGVCGISRADGEGIPREGLSRYQENKGRSHAGKGRTSASLNKGQLVAALSRGRHVSSSGHEEATWTVKQGAPCNVLPLSDNMAFSRRQRWFFALSGAPDNELRRLPGAGKSGSGWMLPRRILTFGLVDRIVNTRKPRKR